MLFQMAGGFRNASRFGEAVRTLEMSSRVSEPLLSKILQRYDTSEEPLQSVIILSPCIMWTEIASWLPTPLWTPLDCIIMQKLYPLSLLQIGGLDWATIAPVIASVIASRLEILNFPMIYFKAESPFELAHNGFKPTHIRK